MTCYNIDHVRSLLILLNVNESRISTVRFSLIYEQRFITLLVNDSRHDDYIYNEEEDSCYPKLKESINAKEL